MRHLVIRQVLKTVLKLDDVMLAADAVLRASVNFCKFSVRAIFRAEVVGAEQYFLVD